MPYLPLPTKRNGSDGWNLPGIEPGSTPSKTALNSVHKAKMQTTTTRHMAIARGAIRENLLSPQGAIRDNLLMRSPIDLIKFRRF